MPLFRPHGSSTYVEMPPNQPFQASRNLNGTTTAAELAILASNCGLVSDTDGGRQSFKAWLASDPKAARKALFSRVAGVAASAGAPTDYPSNWRQASGIRAGRSEQNSPRSTPYPSNWLRATGGRRGRITEGND